MITLDEKKLEEVKNYLAEIPFKYAFPLLQYLEKIAQEQSVEQNPKKIEK